MLDPNVDLHVHRAAAVVAGHVHARIRDTSYAQDPDIETGSVDANGNLVPSQSHTPIPPSGYDWTPTLLAVQPFIDVDARVLFIWADSGRNRRPYIIDILGAVHATNETAIINADGTLSTTGGRVVLAADWSRTTSTSSTLNGHHVVITWTDDGGHRHAFAVAEF